MNYKILSLFLLTVMLSGLVLVSAASFTTSTSSLVFSQPVSPLNFSLTSTNPVNVTIATPTINTVLFSATGNTVDITSARPFTLTPSVTTLDAFKLGQVYSGVMNVTNSENATDSLSMNIQVVKSYCSNGEQSGNLTIESVTIDNNGDGDESAWKPLDDIQVKVKVSNSGSDTDVKVSTTVKLALYSSTGSEELSIDSISLGKIGSSDKTATFDFKVPADLADESYFLYVKAYGTESKVCTANSGDLDGINNLYKAITVEKQDEDGKQVVFDNIMLNPLTATCGDEVTITADLVNVGTSDQEKVKTTLFNKALGVDMYVISDNMDQGDIVPVSFTFAIPAGTVDKVYSFNLDNKYDFNDDYLDEKDAAYDTYGESVISNLKVEGCTPASNAAITAVLQSAQEDVKPGNIIVVKATITNTGKQSTTYLFNVEGADSFAIVQSIEPFSATLAAGESKDILVTLKLNKDSAGEHVLSINALFDSTKVTAQRSISVPAATSIGFNISGLFTNIKNNWIIWVIVLVNVILIAAIIIVAVKLARA